MFGPNKKELVLDFLKEAVNLPGIVPELMLSIIADAAGIQFI